MPLQQAQLLRFTGYFHLQCAKHLVVFGGHRRHATQWRRPIDWHAVMLDAAQTLQRPLGRDTGVGRFQSHAHAHDPK